MRPHTPYLRVSIGGWPLPKWPQKRVGFFTDFLTTPSSYKKIGKRGPNLDPPFLARKVEELLEVAKLANDFSLRVSLFMAKWGRGRLVTLVGEPGIGKTRTAQELATYAGLRSAQVLWGRCYEEQGMPPYWPWVQSIRSYVREHEPEHLTSAMGPGGADIAEIIPEVRQKRPSLDLAPALEPEQARYFCRKSGISRKQQVGELLPRDLDGRTTPGFSARSVIQSRPWPVLLIGWLHHYLADH